jgi:hypothetical protein
MLAKQSGKNNNGHNCRKIVNTGRESASRKIKTNPAGIHEKARTAKPSMSNSTRQLLRRSRLKSVVSEIIVV